MTKESIWFTEPDLKKINTSMQGNLGEHLDIVFTESGPDYLKATMPVRPEIHQPTGRVHGGAYVSLAETVGSVAANWVIDTSKHYCVGQEINANHLRGVREGMLTSVATPHYIGRTSQVWEIKIFDDRDKLCCISRLTMARIQRVND
ncbi:hotdog fold thioesterase [Aurantivibrio plasticivorans]